MGCADGCDDDDDDEAAEAAAAFSGLPYTDAARCNDAATEGPIPLTPGAAAAAGDTTAAPLAPPGLRGPLPDVAT